MAKFEELPIEVQDAFITSYIELQSIEERKREIRQEREALCNSKCKSSSEKEERDARLMELTNEKIGLCCKEISATSHVYSVIEKIFKEK
jgi:hypothetical protein